jgi:hypothetical protein
MNCLLGLDQAGLKVDTNMGSFPWENATMAIPDLTSANREYFIERINRIQSADQRNWGALTPPRLMRHLTRCIEVSLGEGEPVEDKSIPVWRTIFRWLFFHVFTTWPGGKIKVPDDVTPETDATLEDERAQLIAIVDRFLDAVDQDPNRKSMSLAIGPVTLQYAAHIHGVHFNHHFRQYGVVGT